MQTTQDPKLSAPPSIERPTGPQDVPSNDEGLVPEVFRARMVKLRSFGTTRIGAVGGGPVRPEADVLFARAHRERTSAEGLLNAQRKITSVRASLVQDCRAPMPHYDIDPAQSEIAFVVRHMMISKVRGIFRSWKATLDWDPSHISQSSVEVVIDVDSVDTKDHARDEYLRSGEFFRTQTFPKMTFKSTRVEAAGKGKYVLVGDLAIRKQTREVTLDVEETKNGHPGHTGFRAKGTLLRTEWGLTWGQALETGGFLVSDKVELDITVETAPSEQR